MALSRRDFLSRSAAAAAAAPALGARPPAGSPAGPTDRIGPEPAPLRLRVNGVEHEVEAESRTTLLEVLRWQLGLTGSKEVCDRGTCGACTVLIDGRPALACMTLAVDAAGAEITTVEGLGSPESPGRVQAAFIANDALQCGFCTPGFVVATEAALRCNPRAGVEELQRAVAGNQCRCGSLARIRDAHRVLSGGEPAPVPPGNRAACLEPDRPRVDAPEKVCGAARYSADRARPGMLFARHVLCPFGRARLVSADLDAARRLPGVVEVELGVGEWFEYSGAPAGHVCAESPAALRDAIAALRIDWEFEPVETDWLALHRQQHGPFPPREEDLASFRGADRAAAALARAEVVVEAVYRTQVQVHTPLEPHGAMVDPTEQPVKCWVTTQGTFTCVEAMQRGLELDPEDFEVRCDHVGGGFGSKFGAGREGLLAAQLAHRHGRPVRVFNDRENEMLDTGNRPGSLQWYRVGATREGKLLGGFVRTVGITGIGGGGGVTTPFLYDFGALARSHDDLRTPHGAPRPFRAPGRPQGVFGIEVLMDELAERLGLDPVEVRRRNETSEVRRRMLAEGARLIGWDRRRPSGSQRGRLRRGLGCAGGDWGNGKGRCEVRLTAKPDGTIHIFSGMQDIGTGERTVLIDLAAAALELPRERFVLHLASSKYPYGPASGGSTTARLTAPAVRDACAKLKPHLPAREEVTVEGSFNDDYWGRGGSEAVQFVDLVVDAETGVVRIEKIVALQACGQTVNRKTAENQIHGGVIQGIGYALFEDRVTDPQLGFMVNAGLERYLFPGPLDVPEIVPVLWAESDGLGVRSLGEPCTVPTAGAIANAVANAIGAPIRELPITPERVLAALEGRA
ncbi:MAG: twin-arginine translocation signal domain-containing protein [Planctomycetota bacterium]|nr:MAG: twin-arginine translocation signal domain-containing protein [Planctomycetota bacterium]